MTIKSTTRYQITFPKKSAISTRIQSLNQKFAGMDLAEIVKLALIKLDNETNITTNHSSREPDSEEKKAIEEFLKNPQIIDAEESEDFIKSLKKSL